MDPNTEIHNQESVNNKNHPSETNNMLNQENKVPISNSTQQLQETDDKEKVTTKITDQSHSAESIENKNQSQENKDVENIENKANKQPSLESKHVKNDPQVGQKSQISQVTPKGQESVVRKDSQAKSQKSLKDNQLSQPSTGRSEVISKDQANKAAKTKSQELKGKNTPAKNSKDQQNTKTNKDGKKQANSNIEKNQEPTLQNAIASIFSFFKATKDNIAESSNETATRLQEAVMKNPIVTKIRGTEYQSVISSDIFKKDQGKEPGNDPKKSQKSRVNRSQAKAPPKIETEKPKKVPNEVANATKSAKNIKSDTLKDKTSPSKENEKQLPRRAISKPKVKAEGSPGISPLKGKDEVEEQIRLHKIEEVKRMKKVLQDKIDALNDQLFELQKPALLSHHEGETPTRVAFSLEQYKKEQKEEQTNKTKQAHDFAKKMIHERREMEQRREQRREKNQALVVKEIDVFYQKQLNELETLKGSGSAKAKFESNIKKFKEENMFASLEQKKNELKKIREFHKNPTASTTEENTVGDTNNEEGETKSKTKVYKKPLYKSPILEQVLREDAERKKQEEEKLQARKQLHKKLVEYGKEVKSTHLPQVHTAKYFDDDEKITRAIHRSTNMEKNLVRLAGKDGLYGYLDKMRNKYPDLAKPKESGTDSQDIGHSKKVKAKQQRHRDEDEEEEEGNYSGEDGDGHGHNYGLEEDWDLTERTDNHEEAPRDSHNKKQGIKNLKDQSYHPNRKSAAQENKTPDDSRVSEKSRQNHQKVGKKHQVEQKGVEAADEDNEWEEELKNDQDILKEKISSMLGDIKKMENQIKHKEEILLQDIERKKHANA